jgi:hypothetical protein
MTTNQVLDQAFKSVVDHFRTINIRDDLPSVHVNDRDVWTKLPRIPAAYFLLACKGRRLDGIPDPWGDEGRSVVKYVGRATLLSNRWIYKAQSREDHRQLAASLEHGEIWLHWLAMKPQYLAMAEVALIRLHRPAWNRCRT